MSNKNTYSKINSFLNKDIKELNGIILSLFCITFLFISGFISYKISNSYALFGDDVTGSKTLSFMVSVDKTAPVISSVSSNYLPGVDNLTSYNFTISASDSESVLDSCIITTTNNKPSLDDSGWEKVTASPYTTVATRDRCVQASHYIFVKDKAGNISEPYSHTLTCFTGDTYVLTELGLRYIKDLKPGDIVISKNMVDGTNEKKVVSEKFIHDVKSLYLIKTDKETLETTKEHIFYVKNREWIPAGKIEVGDILIDNKGNEVVVKSLLEKAVNEKVYNIEVEDNHNYYVVLSNILVHNSKEVCKAPGPEL